MQPIRVLVADDHPAFREGVVGRLSREPGIEVLAEAQNGEAALQMIRSMQPDVVILDLEMPGLSGVEVTRRVIEHGIDTQVLVLSAHEDEDGIFAVLEAGAAGYLTKQESLSTIVDAVRGVAKGETGWLSRRIAALFVKNHRRSGSGLFSPLQDLSDREREVLERIAHGDSNAQIADVLFISESTVKKHANTLYQKLGVQTRAQAIVWAWRNGIARN